MVAEGVNAQPEVLKCPYRWHFSTSKRFCLPKPEGEEGWPNRLEIKEIISVKKQDSDLD